MPYFSHDSAYVDPGAKIGDGTNIWHFCHIRSTATIGTNCNIGQNVFVDADASIGNRCKIQNNVSIYMGVILEDDVFCGPSMVFTNVINPRAHIKKIDQRLETRVKRGATLGANSTIVCGVTIGEFAFVGAGAVVTRDVPAHALIFGNPAQIQGWVCACGEKLNAKLTCSFCNKKYIKCDGGLAEANAN